MAQHPPPLPNGDIAQQIFTHLQWHIAERRDDVAVAVQGHGGEQLQIDGR